MAHWQKVVEGLRRFKSEMPTLTGNEMVNFALDNLEAETDAYGVPMTPRKSTVPRNAGRRILKDKGDGDRSIRVSRKTSQLVEVSANIYMAAHNEGATISTTANVRSHTRTRKGRSERVSAHTRNINTKLPARTFLAPTKALFERIYNVLEFRFKTLTK